MTDSARSVRMRARLDAPAYVHRMMNSFLAREGVDLDEIRRDPIGWLRHWPEVEVFDLERSRTASDERCDVDGLYRGEETPPRIGVAFSSVRQRMNFTALHELGHHIQLTDEDLLENLLERGDGGSALEEEACDAFASAVLIPEATAKSLLGTRTPSAEAVVELWRALSTVSRSAVAMRARDQIDGDGHVIVLSGTGEVTFATSTTAIRPARRSDQTATAIWEAIERGQEGATVTARGRFAYNSVLAGDTYFMQATPAGSGYIVVAATERVPWTLSVARQEYVPYGRSYVCLHLGCVAEFRAGPNELCATCGNPICPTCQRCGCSVAAPAEFQCTECFLLKSGSQQSATTGVCEECAD